MNKKFILLIVMLLLLVGCGKIEEQKEIKSGKISCGQLKEIVKNDDSAIILDVRTKEEYDSGHIDGAINIPYEVVVEELGKMEGITLDTKIIVYCKSGNRSGQAYNSLKVAGYVNVYDLGALGNCK